MGYQVASIRPEDCFWAQINSSGYAMGTTGTISNGSDAGMGQMNDVRGASLPVLRAATVNFSAGSIRQADPRTPLEGSVTVGTRDETFVSKINGLTTAAIGDATTVPLSSLCPLYTNICMILNQPSINSTSGAIGYHAYALMSAQFSDNETIDLAFGTEQVDFVYPFGASFVATTFWTQATASLSSSYNVSKIHIHDFGWSAYPWTAHTYVGDNSTTTFTLDQTPAGESANKVELWQAGTKQTYTTNYTVTASTKTVTFVAAPGTGVVAVALYQYVPSC